MSVQAVIKEKAETLKTMGNPTRLAILVALLSGPKSFSELKKSVGTTDGQIYHHLLYLGAQDFIETERPSITIYSLTTKGRTALKLLRG